MEFKKVLLCTDFSVESEKLVQTLYELKDLGLEEVIVFNVVEIDSAGSNAPSFQKQKKEALKADQRQLEKEGLKVKIDIKIGTPAKDIVKKGEEENVDLILIGSHGKGFIKRILLGSTTFDVIRLSKIPVLVEKYKGVEKDQNRTLIQNKFDKVLLPIDYSSHAMGVLEKVKGMKKIREILLVSAIEYSQTEEELTEARDKLERHLGKIRMDLFNAGFASNYIIKEGTASNNILEVAENEAVNLVILSKRGEGRIKELLIGSTATTVITNSKAPVLIFPSQEV
ncbi:universal stress protein [Isachenkonia alkalipeptolytica]|uniref:Universal stress protein n=1 Tax=Isachenkonia alkalipeptolytica TaxID=2565777 RepID=A0AA43XLL4_9CLOT|nr:universal stress protein [Isachenkonia alkalipeptolytica]NBG88504.1 universal stress protein [Isachenkonia alkalipeptolytica]